MKKGSNFYEEFKGMWLKTLSQNNILSSSWAKLTRAAHIWNFKAQQSAREREKWRFCFRNFRRYNDLFIFLWIYVWMNERVSFKFCAYRRWRLWQKAQRSQGIQGSSNLKLTWIVSSYTPGDVPPSHLIFKIFKLNFELNA